MLSTLIDYWREAGAIASLYEAAADEAMEGHLYSLAWVIGRECGVEGKKIVDTACAAIGKSHATLENEYLEVLAIME